MLSRRTGTGAVGGDAGGGHPLLGPSGALLLPTPPPFDAAAIDPGLPGLWRYRALLGLPSGAEPLTLGEGWTPLVSSRLGAQRVAFKLDFLQPSFSYKDRGFATLFTLLRYDGVRAVVEDSSGNAGASAAAYGAAAGIDVTLCWPRGGAGRARRAQAAASGAALDERAPTRAAAGRRALALAGAGTVYASHVYHPGYLLGQLTVAWEIWEQLGRAPDDVVVPVGHGGLLLGLAMGFESLLEAGLIERRPRLHGVQAAAVAPIATAFAAGDARARRVEPAAGPLPAAAAPGTLATGIGITDPPRGADVLAAVRRSRGTVHAVSEADIVFGQRTLARLGWYVEPTSAVVAGVAEAVARDAGPEAVIVAVLTGAGLKVDPAERGREAGKR